MRIIIKRKKGVGIILISYLKGTIMHKTENSIVLLCGHIGYEILIPANRINQYKLNEEYPFYIVTHVREDAISLYGFDSWNERDMFLMLQNVSGIGSKSALAIVGQVTFSGLYQAVAQENIAMFTKIPGVGKKTAQRLVLELKDRFPKNIEFEFADAIIPEITTNPETSMQKDDIYNVLLSLGYKEYEIRNIYGKIKPMIGVEEEQTIIKTALKLLTKI